MNMNGGQDAEHPRRIFPGLEYVPGMVLVLFLLVLPAAYQEIKAGLITVVIAQVLLAALRRGRMRLHPTVLFLFAFYLMLGMVHGLHGVHRGNLGALMITKELVPYVLVYMLLVAGVRDVNALRMLHRTLVIASALLCLYALDQILYAL